jgi:hypothetical protein
MTDRPKPRVSDPLPDEQITYLLTLPRGTSSLPEGQAAQWLVVALQSLRDARAELARMEAALHVEQQIAKGYEMERDRMRPGRGGGNAVHVR